MSLTAVAFAMTIEIAAFGGAADAVEFPSAKPPVGAGFERASLASGTNNATEPAAVGASAAAPVPVLSATPPEFAPLILISPPASSPPAEVPVSDATDSSEASPVEGEDQPEIVVEGSFVPTPGDPLERLNAESYEIVQSIDGAVVEPVAKAYNKGVPRPIRQGLRNFFSNLDEPIIFAAYLLQLKPVSAVKTAVRFAINTTIGIAGLVDVAKRKPFNLPYQPNGVANTLGYYGVGPGPYFYLPIVGPTTLRDLVGDTAEIFMLPVIFKGPFTDPVVTGTATVLDQLGERAAFDERINQIREEDDAYGTYRDLYLKQRQAEIDALHGRETEDVVPVYGPGLRTADEKADKQDADRQEAEKPEDGNPEADQPLSEDAPDAVPESETLDPQSPPSE